MQGKVSMVVPCYNKEEFIGDMLHSVCRQVWDNIEIILVNDGSTDSTREIISIWEPRLRERGYEVIVIDQENQGCCAAVYNGMLRMNGDYFCLVDCDDEIFPEYVSRMAGWLDEHPDYDLAACNYVMYKGTPAHNKFSSVKKKQFTADNPKFLENYLTYDMPTAAWVYMSRRKRAMRIIDSFCTERRKTYEPLIIIPLAFGNPKVKYFNEALYKYNLYALGFMTFKSYEKISKFYDDYIYLQKWVIERLEINENEKLRLITLGEAGCIKAELRHSWRLENYPDDIKTFLKKESAYFQKWRSITHNFYKSDEAELFCSKLETDIFAVNLKRLPKDQGMINWGIMNFKSGGLIVPVMSIIEGRVIAWGALGARADKLIPKLKNTPLEPTDLWDVMGDGIYVKKPDVGSLTENDTVLIFPGDKTIQEEIYEQLKDIGCRVMLSNKIIELMNYNYIHWR